MLKVLISVHSKCEVYHYVKNPVVQRVEGIVPRIINHHPVDSTICCTCPIDGDKILVFTKSVDSNFHAF